MEVIKIIGIGLISLIIIVILKQNRPEFALYVTLIAGVLIIALVIGQVCGIIDLLKNISNKSMIDNKFITLLLKVTGIGNKTFENIKEYIEI